MDLSEYGKIYSKTVYAETLTHDNGNLTISANTQLTITGASDSSIDITSGNLTLSTVTSGDLILNPSGDINASSNTIKNVATPSSTNDAANKTYVDTQFTSVEAIGKNNDTLELTATTAYNPYGTATGGLEFMKDVAGQDGSSVPKYSQALYFGPESTAGSWRLITNQESNADATQTKLLMQVLESVSIASVSDAGNVIATSAAHGYSTGEYIYISGTDCTPDINGEQKIYSVPTTTEIKLDNGGSELDITAVTTGTGTSKRWTTKNSIAQ